MSYKGLLKQKCTVYRKTTTFGGRGQSVVTWSATETNIKCSVQMETIVREEYQVADRGERSFTSFTGYFLYGTDIKEGDKVELSTGETFHTDRVHRDAVGRSHHIEADLELLRAE